MQHKLEGPVKQLFVNFILNRATQAEKARVRQLIERGGHELEWREALEITEQEFAHSSHSGLLIDESRILENIHQKITPKSRFGLGKNWRWLASAAAILLVLGIGLLWLPPAGGEPSLTAIRKESPKLKNDSPRKWLKLPDGTSVQLNHDSHLEYPENFSGKAQREVRLIGEAYFDVRHDPKHPFVIHTGKIKTTVLGTAFNINAYQASRAVTVTVTRGKVRVENEEQLLAILVPDEQLAWRSRSPEPEKIKVNAASFVEWKKQDLIMDDISMAEAAQMIAERYSVKVQFLDENVRPCRFTAAFLNRNEIGQVLSVISDITGATLTLKNNLVTIAGPGC